MPPAPTPRILWVELTSKCPFDCLFCSRKTRRGAGEHMPYALFESLVRQVASPRVFLLNYSGESTVYPHLIPAIRLARSTGARVELVTALASAAESLLEPLANSGLTRLTVSLHATDESAFQAIYRHASYAQLEQKLRRFVEHCRGAASPPAIDLAFVAMQRNLYQLAGVAELAVELGLPAIHIFPVIRRDAIPVDFPIEIGGNGRHRADFRAALNQCVEDVRLSYPQIALTVGNPQFTGSGGALGEAPQPCPGDLPAGAVIHSCEQNPFETAHILANGDVVACEVHDHTPLGNLGTQTLAEIWRGPEYARFRERYVAGEHAECRACPWKTARLPRPAQPEILAARGWNAQLGYGWHAPDGEAHIWSSQQAVATLEPRAGSQRLHIAGILAPGPDGHGNELGIVCNGVAIGHIENQSKQAAPFDREFDVPADCGAPWEIDLQTRFAYRPCDRGDGPDQRDLGFALAVLASQPAADAERAAYQRAAAERLMAAIERIDRAAIPAAAMWRRARPRFATPPANRGLSVLIPECGNVAELAECLEGLEAAAQQWPEPIERRVIVNGAPTGDYAQLTALHPQVKWEYHADAMGFGGAIAAGLRSVRYDWVYLLNSDATLSENALAALMPHRTADVFSIASRIFLKDATRFPEETNFTALRIEDGLVCAHDLVPPSAETVEHFYSGGGASLFQTRVLRRVLDPAAYHPFYWEDIEWGWRARRLGYRALFCPDSEVRHTQRGTIGRRYAPAQIEAIVERNRLLFQLRNFTYEGSTEAMVRAIAAAPPETAAHLTSWRTFAGIAKARWWNFAAASEGSADPSVAALRRAGPALHPP